MCADIKLLRIYVPLLTLGFLKYERLAADKEMKLDNCLDVVQSPEIELIYFKITVNYKE